MMISNECRLANTEVYVCAIQLSNWNLFSSSQIPDFMPKSPIFYQKDTQFSPSTPSLLQSIPAISNTPSDSRADEPTAPSILHSASV
jgi:hypothetical protein